MGRGEVGYPGGPPVLNLQGRGGTILFSKCSQFLKCSHFFMKENVLKMEEKVLIHELWKIMILFLNCSHFYGKTILFLECSHFLKIYQFTVHRGLVLRDEGFPNKEK